MFVDSHCHLNLKGLAERVPQLLDNMRAHSVSHALCVGIDLEAFPEVLALAQRHNNVFASVGVHPADASVQEPDVDGLVQRAASSKVVAIGETGLDYFRLEGRTLDAAEWQRKRFRTHIRAARALRLPLIIHTRAAIEDTLILMREEGAEEVGGVMHCFTEGWDAAQEALALNFHISISGIVTFKNASAVQEVARRVPLQRLLIETDSPYLAPAPHRGAVNEPAFVHYVGRFVAQLRGETETSIATATTENFFTLFKRACTFTHI
ncbi:TatD family hydrolase [Candidatus Glomeribacter gigasporarum]|uniref:TatD family hydrolase n=1 Tax=Candidatus Glomeribacter gigasporarum TaxID=132144 RepID=UPI0002D4B10D|nr:TatD family hydrolase [Candidatus Glomeribacter gigasporarum]